MTNMTKLTAKIAKLATKAVEEFKRHGGENAGKRAKLLTKIFMSNATASGAADLIATAAALMNEIN